MATRILDFDLSDPLPETIPTGGSTRIWVIAWSAGAPVGTALLRPRSGAATLSGTELAEALAALERASGLERAPAAVPLPSLSVVICTRNRPDRLPIALAALAGQTIPDFELVVVDNAPAGPATRRVVERHAPRARYVVEPVPGLPRARNAGIRAATGEIVAFTDDDCRPAPTWVEAIARAFATTQGLGCVTGPILPLELETSAQEAMEERGGFNRGFRRILFTADSEAGPVYPVQAWRFGAGGSMALSRTCLEAIGGFDDALWRSEDLDIFYRTLRAGYVLAFEPGAAVRHRHLPRWSQLARRLFHWGWGYATYLDKIARFDAPPFADRARLERRNWLRYQLRSRALPALRRRGDLPFALVLLELAGGLFGLGGYPVARALAARRATQALARRAPSR